MEHLQAVSLSKSYGTHNVLNNLNFAAPAGCMVAVTGRSGSGKSTLLNILGLLEEPTSGSVTLDGVRMTGLSNRAATGFRRHVLGYLFQNYALIESTTVRQNLKVALPGMRRHQSRGAMLDLLEQVGLTHALDAPIAELSGGEQQRVALVRLLLRQPRLILADEPTGALDDANANLVIAALAGLARQGSTVLIATHSAVVSAACHTTIDLGATVEQEIPDDQIRGIAMSSSSQTRRIGQGDPINPASKASSSVAVRA